MTCHGDSGKTAHLDIAHLGVGDGRIIRDEDKTVRRRTPFGADHGLKPARFDRRLS